MIMECNNWLKSVDCFHPLLIDEQLDNLASRPQKPWQDSTSSPRPRATMDNTHDTAAMAPPPPTPPHDSIVIWV